MLLDLYTDLPTFRPLDYPRRFAVRSYLLDEVMVVHGAANLDYNSDRKVFELYTKEDLTLQCKVKSSNGCHYQIRLDLMRIQDEWWVTVDNSYKCHIPDYSEVPLEPSAGSTLWELIQS